MSGDGNGAGLAEPPGGPDRADGDVSPEHEWRRPVSPPAPAQPPSDGGADAAAEAGAEMPEMPEMPETPETPEQHVPGTLPPAPRGWSQQEWEQSFYGKPSARRSPLAFGRGWLLAVVFLCVLAVLIVVLVETR